MKLKLDNVTLLGVDCLDVSRLKRSFDICTYYCDFSDIKFLTSLDTTGLEYPAVKIHPINSKEEYSKFMIKELNNYVDTDYVLIVQYDGFICNPNAWTNEFLKYDYIGAPWWYDNHNVGNGGFSLRSKKLLNILQNDKNITVYHPEDNQICRIYREYLESLGIVFANDDIAIIFSYECSPKYKDPWKDQFGYHGGITGIRSTWKDYNNFFRR